MKYTLVLFYVISFISLPAQYAMNLGTTVSPLRSISHKVGYTDVKVTYSSPSVNGRTIWGELEPYDEVWRAGANYATTISFSENVLINEKSIDKGTYALFIIPREHDDWTIILNKKAKQWGAFNYSEEEDIIRLSARPHTIYHQESLRYDIISDDSRSGVIAVMWDKVKVEFSFKTKLAEALSSVLEKNLINATNETRWINYIQAAEILLNENQSLLTARDWIDRAERDAQLEMEWHPQFYPKDYVLGHLYWTKSKILAAQQQYKDAIEYANHLISIEGQSFYSKEKEDEEIDLKIRIWRSKMD